MPAVPDAEIRRGRARSMAMGLRLDDLEARLDDLELRVTSLEAGGRGPSADALSELRDRRREAHARELRRSLVGLVMVAALCALFWWQLG
jgi:hypothetical protein